MTRLIDADLLRKQFRKRELERNGYYLNGAMVFNIRKIIDEAPTVEERPHGEWIPINIDGETWDYKCSGCGGEVDTDYPNCPWCLADMRGKKDDLAEIIEAAQSLKER